MNWWNFFMSCSNKYELTILLFQNEAQTHFCCEIVHFQLGTKLIQRWTIFLCSTLIIECELHKHVRKKWATLYFFLSPFSNCCMHYLAECACTIKTKDVKKQQVSMKNGSKYEKLSYYENKTFLKKKWGVFV